MNKGTKETLSVEDEVKELKGLSWFDIDEKYRKSTNRKSLTRIVFVSLIDQAHSYEQSLTSDSTSAIEIASKIYDFFNVFINGEGEKEGNDIYGGVVLATDGNEDNNETTAALGFLEVDSPRFTQRILSKLCCEDSESNTSMHSIRILLVSDDCPCNNFESFGVYIAQSPSEDSVDIMKEGPTIVFSAMMKKLCKQCKSFNAEPDRKGNVKVLSGLNRKAIPSSLRIASCAKCDAYPTIKEYMDIFHSPIYFELDSERSAPLLPVVDWKEVESIASSLFPKERQFEFKM